MDIKLNLGSLKEKILSLSKRDVAVIVVIIFASMLLYLKFSKREDNFHLLMELEPSRNFVINDIMEQEKRKVFNAIKEEDERHRGVGRDVFFSYKDEDGIAPNLTGVMIGRRKLATFSNGLILSEGDDFYGHRIQRIMPGRVVLRDSFGDEKTLEMGRN